MRLWDVADPAVPRLLGAPLDHTGQVWSVAFAPNGRTLASAGAGAPGSNGTVRLWDVTDRTAPRLLGAPLTGHTDTVDSVAFAPDGWTLASGGYVGDRTVRLWAVD